jgi:hypothetical protein
MQGTTRRPSLMWHDNFPPSTALLLKHRKFENFKIYVMISMVNAMSEMPKFVLRGDLHLVTEVMTQVTCFGRSSLKGDLSQQADIGCGGRSIEKHTWSCASLLAHSSMPCDLIPRMLRAFKLARTTTRRP